MTRSIDFEYRVLRGGAFFGRLQAPESGGRRLRMDDAAEIKTSLSGTFSPIVEDVDGKALQPDWLSDEIQPVMILDGVEHRLGIYMPATVTPTESNGIQELQIEAYDRCWRVRDTYTRSSLYFAAGTNYLDAVEQMLAGCGIALIIKTPTAQVFAEAREDWAVGTSSLTIVNQLLAEISYKPLWFNEAGAAVLEPAAVPTAENIEHTLSDQPEALTAGASEIIRMLPQIRRETDIYQAANVFVCVCSNADKSGPLVATSRNTNPQSPLSTMRRGREIVKVVRVNNVADQAALQAYADRLRNESMLGGETIRVTTALQPGFGVADVTAIRYGELSAVCVEHAWTMELAPGGAMTHELERVVINLE